MPLAGSVVTEEDEAAAMAAMFQAQSANWEEAQEKMSQSVSRARAVFRLVEPVLMNFILLPVAGNFGL